MASAGERVHEIKSPLPPNDSGQDPFFLSAMKVSEQISRPFKYVVDLYSLERDIDPTKLLGESLTVIVKDRGRTRHFNGQVSSFVSLGISTEYTHYRAILRPWFWFLKQTANCRIFQEMSVPDIFEKVVKDTHGFSDYRLSLSASYNPRVYCVQYRETDMRYVSRLLEEEGIFYYFEHEEGKHTLVLGDSVSAFDTMDAPDSGADVPFHPPGDAIVDTEHVSLWEVHHRVKSTTYVYDDFDFEKPKVDLLGQSTISREHSQAEYEVYDYPGRYAEVRDGESLAKVRIEELQSGHKRINAHSDHRSLQVGFQFNLIEHPIKSENDEYVVFATEINIQSAEVEVMREGAEHLFDIEFVAFPSSEVFRPGRSTPRPTVKGPQTAIVVGKSGEEIWTDKYARVKVQFHWDREGESNENSSCWIRVAQVWAGKGWGAMQIPRIDQEVVVDFLEGDPDRPLITGRVYNDDEMPPYDLPDNQTQSGLKSRSTKGATPENFNELRFEDKKDEEEVYLHAEKDFTRVVENDDVTKVGFEKMDPGDQTIEVYNHQNLKVGEGSGSGSQTIDVQQDRTATIIAGDDSTTVSAGNHSLAVSAGESTIEAAQKITLKVGGSTIEITPAGITIKSVQVAIEGQAQLEAKGAMATFEGSGMCQVKGGLVKIN
jgi:type VI secretion system secreted protein VgrG